MNRPNLNHPAFKIIFWSAFAGIVLLATIHGIQTRSIKDYSFFSKWVFVVLCAFISIIFINIWLIDTRGMRSKQLQSLLAIGLTPPTDYEQYVSKQLQEQTRRNLLVFRTLIIYVAIVALLIVPICYFVCVSIVDLFKWVLLPSLPDKEAVPIVICFTLFVGVVLFAFRLYLRSLYGVTEILIGLLVAGNRISESQAAITEPKFYLTLLTAGIYLVVRGLDNAHQGFTKPDPFALIIFNFAERLKQLKKYRRFNTRH